MDTKTAVFCLFATAAAFMLFDMKASDPQSLYNQWKKDLRASFSHEEDVYRFKVFEDNLAKVIAHNSKLGRTHTEAINQFSFLTQDEFAAQYLSEIAPSLASPDVLEESEDNGQVIDWVSRGAVSPVKNQGSCQASYAFSSVSALEGLSVIYYNKKQEFSAQQLVDCSSSYGNSGCSTGTMTASFSYVKDKGITTQSGYPWTEAQRMCRFQGGSFKVSGYIQVRSGDCNSLANSLSARPISVAVDGANMRGYSFGIYYNCGVSLSLALTLVGMDDTAWKLKNSWGTQWGEGGYIRIGRGNTCGVCLAASYPTPL